MTKPLSLALGTRDRADLSERAIKPLIHDDIDLWIVDGSQTVEGMNFPIREHHGGSWKIRANITGGADAWIVYALTTLLNETESPYVGIVENDCLLHADWLGPTLALFNRGAADNLLVGAVSARAYADRILVQRDGYSLMHNLGAGHLILTRKAARLVLDTYRTHWTTANVKIFQALSGIDVRKYWAFRGHQHFITVDWGINAMLAAHGLASLALTPSPCEMIGQDPPLEEQGLRLATEPVELLRNDDAFKKFAETTLAIRRNQLALPGIRFCRLDDGSQVIFPHQIGALPDANQHGDWRMKWSQGFGPFCWVADPQENEPPPTLDVPLTGACTFMVSGGRTGGRVRLTDTQSGYEIEPELPPEGEEKKTMNLAVPGSIHHRVVRLTALSPGVTFYGVQVNEPQPVDPMWTFDYSVLPKP